MGQNPQKYKVSDPMGFKRPRYVEYLEPEIEFRRREEVERLCCDFSWGIEALKNCAKQCDSREEWEDE